MADAEWDWSAPFDEDFVRGASVREAAGEARVRQARRIAKDHAVAETWRAPQVAAPHRTERLRTMLIGVLVVAVLGALLAFTDFTGALSEGARSAGSPTAQGDGSLRMPVPGDAAVERLAPPAVAPAGSGGFALLHGTSRQPFGFDPCRPVHWVMRDAGAPPGAVELLQRSFSTLAAATGLVFVHDGTTTEDSGAQRPVVQPDRYGDRYAPVLVAWSDPQETPRLAGGIGGFAGPYAVDPDGKGPRYVTGTVVLDGPQLGTAVSTASGVVLHELGHLVGLDHVDAPDDTMHASSAAGATAYTAGALRGLALVGSGRCFR